VKIEFWGIDEILPESLNPLKFKQDSKWIFSEFYNSKYRENLELGQKGILFYFK
jgi:hypothetical protein